MLREIGYCRICGGRYLDSELSNRGNCPRCWLARVREAATQLHQHFGPLYDKWRLNYIAAMNGVLNKLRKEIEQDELPL